jgi:O-acetyl-ADP-ribose deacetylase (regulator of RNase III)
VFNFAVAGVQSLRLNCSTTRAVINKCESIAFPLISSGIYGYPKGEALRVATSAVQDFIADHGIEVVPVVFDCASFSVRVKRKSDDLPR